MRGKRWYKEVLFTWVILIVIVHTTKIPIMHAVMTRPTPNKTCRDHSVDSINIHPTHG